MPDQNRTLYKRRKLRQRLLCRHTTVGGDILHIKPVGGICPLPNGDGGYNHSLKGFRNLALGVDADRRQLHHLVLCQIQPRRFGIIHDDIPLVEGVNQYMVGVFVGIGLFLQEGSDGNTKVILKA